MLLSVIVTVVDGGSTLQACLEGLARQSHPPQMEILVPFDDTLADVKALRDQFPAVQFIEMGAVSTRSPKHSYAGQHELFDYRRAAGLATASGDIIAILEDRGVPRSNWARVVHDIHDQPHAVIGGGDRERCRPAAQLGSLLLRLRSLPTSIQSRPQGIRLRCEHQLQAGAASVGPQCLGRSLP